MKKLASLFKGEAAREQNVKSEGEARFVSTLLLTSTDMALAGR